MGNFLLAITSSIVARVLLALGMGVVSYQALSSIAEIVVDNVNNTYNNLPAAVIDILDMAGFGASLSILGSALITRAGLMAIKKLRIL